MKKSALSIALALVLALTPYFPALGTGSSGPLGKAHTLSGDYYVKTDGTLWKLSGEETGLPVLVASGISSVYAGNGYQAVVRTDGTVRSDWGRNFGDPEVPWSTEEPYQAALPVEGAAYVSCGGYAMGVVTGEGEVWMWGEVTNPFTDPGAYVPYMTYCINTDAPSFLDPHGNGAVMVMDHARSVCVAQEAVAVIRTDGSLWTWGRSDFGGLGNGGDYNYTGVGTHHMLEPARILEDVTQVSLGRSFGAAVTADGSLYVWGTNSRGQQASGESGPDCWVDRPVKRMDNVVRIACYEQNAAAITADGSLYVWGESYRGTVGNGSTSLVTEPVKIMEDVVDVSFIPGGTSRGTLALKRDGTLWAWGKASLLGRGWDFEGNDTYSVRGTLFPEGERLQTTPIQVAEGVALPDFPDTRPAVAGFDDVREGDYFAEAVLWASDNAITKGTGAAAFSPEATVTRGQAVTFLWRAMGEPEPEAGANPFADVGEDDYYCKPVLWACSLGITKGTGEGEFSPDGPVTRGQMLTFLYRTLGEPDKTGEGAWYADAERWAAKTKLTEGADSAYATDDACPRRDVVFYLWKALG